MSVDKKAQSMHYIGVCLGEGEERGLRAGLAAVTYALLDVAAAIREANSEKRSIFEQTFGKGRG